MAGVVLDIPLRHPGPRRAVMNPDRRLWPENMAGWYSAAPMAAFTTRDTPMKGKSDKADHAISVGMDRLLKSQRWFCGQLTCSDKIGSSR